MEGWFVEKETRGIPTAVGSADDRRGIGSDLKKWFSGHEMSHMCGDYKRKALPSASDATKVVWKDACSRKDGTGQSIKHRRFSCLIACPDEWDEFSATYSETLEEKIEMKAEGK